MRTMYTRTRALCAAAVTVAALAATGSTAATASAADAGVKGTCVQTATGTTTMAAGALTSHRAFDSAGTSNDYGCLMPDPTIHSAKEVWSQSGTAVCLPFTTETADGTDTWTWDNGRTSVMTYHDQIVEGVDYTTGVFTSGEFTGMHVTWAGVGATFTDPVGSVTGIVDWCVLGKRRTAPADYAGVAVFH